MRLVTLKASVWTMTLAALAQGCSGPVVVGSGDQAKDLREVGSFEGVEVQGSVNVRVKSGETPSVEVVCDDNLLDYIKTGVEGGTLVVSNRRQGMGTVQIEPLAPICEVRIVAVGLNELTSHGSADLWVGGDPVAVGYIEGSGSGQIRVDAAVVVETLEVGLSGSGDAWLADVEVASLVIETSGSGGVEVGEGTAQSVDLEVSGSGDALLQPVTAGSVSVDLSGSGGAEVTALESVRGDLSGSGGVQVWGDPAQRDVSVSGSGDVEFMD